MKVLVVGSGGREHALTWKLKNSSGVSSVYCCPGNAGIAREASCLPIAVSDFNGIVKAAKENSIDLIVIGPEQPLVDGLADRCIEEGIAVFGPVKEAAQLEGSKIFAKEFMARNGIPTAEFRIFDSSPESVKSAKKYVHDNERARVVKADGLCAGKGAIVCSSAEEAAVAIERIAVQKEFGSAGDRFIVEEKLRGQELSVLVLSDGKRLVPLISSQDHKQIFAGDKGPNTGGMGAYAPVPFVTYEEYQKIIGAVCSPLIRGFENDGIQYRGVIYAGLMIDGKNLNVLEFNCRFGDPETQPILFMLKSDFAGLLYRCAVGKLEETKLEWEPGYAVCVVVAAGGYPGAYEKGKIIAGLDEAETRGPVKVFHAGTASRDGAVVTNGGRVLGVTARGTSLREALDAAYNSIKYISFENHYFRPDIGFRVL